jgi:uncharacterized membrane protein YfcA
VTSSRQRLGFDARAALHDAAPAIRRWAYLATLAVVLTVWAIYMTASMSWHLFTEFWPITVTMSFGSFIAGATPQGGAAVAFPVFTKVLGIDSETARTFGLLVQSVGMMMAALVIVVRKVPILPRVILWASVGGLFGQILGTFWISLGAPYAKILFSFVAAVFAAALILSRWVLKLPVVETLPTWRANDPIFYAVIGLVGGILAANTGSGVDMLTFVVLTLAIGVNEKVSTPTSVIIMGINSVVGASLHAFVLNDVGIAFSYWLVAIPVVVIGAPLGAYAASKASRDMIIIFLVSLIGIELTTTLILVPFSATGRLVSALAIVVSIAWFSAMIAYRVTHIVPAVRAQDDVPMEQQDTRQMETERSPTR